MNKVTVLGATGYTGQLVVAELQRLQIPFNIAGRNAQKLRELAARLHLSEDVAQIVADSTQSSSLPSLFENHTRVLINCAGPFTRLGEPVVRAATHAGVHYLDITGEQSFIACVIQQYDIAAQLKNCALIPACGVEYALSNWLAALAAEGLEPLDEIITATHATSIQATSGTQLSLFQALAAPALGWENGGPVRRLTAGQSRSLKFPSGTYRAVWSPFGETVTLPRQFQVKNVASFVALPMPLAASLQVFAPVLPLTSRIMGSVFERLLKSGRGPTLANRQQARWEMIAIARSPHSQRYASLTGSDAYGLTAHIIGYVVREMLSPAFGANGALGPAQAFEAREALQYLSDFGLSFQVETL